MQFSFSRVAFGYTIKKTLKVSAFKRETSYFSYMYVRVHLLHSKEFTFQVNLFQVLFYFVESLLFYFIFMLLSC